VSEEDRKKTRQTLNILYCLQTLGLVKQVLGADGKIRWKAKGTKRHFDWALDLILTR
jgi:hypothetical protein